MNVVKFPYSASRRVMARRPRTSKNGTPEERAAAKAAAKSTAAAPVIEISRGSIVDLPPEIQAAQWREFERLLGKLAPNLRPAALSYLRQLADGGAA